MTMIGHLYLYILCYSDLLPTIIIYNIVSNLK